MKTHLLAATHRMAPRPWGWEMMLGVLLSALLAGPAAAQRLVQSLNTNWQFRKDEAATLTPVQVVAAPGWTRVAVPHTWNATDVLDDEPGYYRGTGWYRKTLYVPADWQRRRVYLRFEGANQETEVYVNGQLAGRHVGGYTAFCMPVSRYLKFEGPNPAAAEVLVKVTNRHNPDIPPLSADFTFYGGLYRDVHLVAADPVHFDLDNKASSGTFVTTPAVSAAAAEVVVSGAVTNEATTARKVTVLTQLLDQDGRTVARQQTSVALKAGEKRPFRQLLPRLRQPRLWSPDSPYLYRVVSQVLDGKNAEPLDEVTHSVGMRWFRFDASQGFFLNGQSLKLVGTNRHQDFEGRGNSLPDALHERDVQLLKNMGGNFLRVSHYPQDPAVLQACDRLGILASVEIPIVNAITDSKDFFENCRTMQTEMIRQNFNHPSVIIWAYMNEVLLRLPPGITQENAAGQAYFGRVAALAQDLDDLTRREDPARYTMIVNHGSFELYGAARLTRIPMLVGWNLYQGWYSPKLTDFAAFLDRHHRELPDKPVLITEYGADADHRLHALPAQRFDKTQEYANQYHQYYHKAMQERPFVAGSAAWNLADFNSEARQEATPHVNTKGLLTTDRQPKDTYLFYQAQLLKTPFLKIGSRGWTLRAGTAAGSDSLFCRQLVEVYTNQPAVQLQLNGRSLGTHPAEAGVARFQVPFGNGLNQLRAEAANQPVTDQVDIEFQLLPTVLASAQLPFKELNVSLGDQRYFTDLALHQVWVPEQAYTPGGWGYVGGHIYKPAGDRVPYGSDRNILGTDYDALYQTQRLGLQQFRCDVPEGDYEVVLHFAELEKAPQGEQLVYNLAPGASGAAPAAPKPNRSFTVLINGQPVGPALSADTYLLPLQAVRFKVPVSVRGKQGIVVDFQAQTGEAVLNGIQVKRQ